MVSEDSTCTVLLCARCLLMLLLAADSKERWCAVCGITSKITCNMELKQKNDVVPIRTRNNPAAFKTHPHQKSLFLFTETPCMDLRAGPTPKGYTSDMPSMQPTEHTRTSPAGSTGSEHMPLYPSCERVLESSVSRAMPTGALEASKKLVEVALTGSKIRLASWLGCELLINC